MAVSYNFLESARLLGDASVSFKNNCVDVQKMTGPVGR